METEPHGLRRDLCKACRHTTYHRGAFHVIEPARAADGLYYEGHLGVSAVRLTHGFEKDKGRTAEGRTPRKHLDMAVWVFEKGVEQDDREH